MAEKRKCPWCGGEPKLPVMGGVPLYLHRQRMEQLAEFAEKELRTVGRGDYSANVGWEHVKTELARLLSTLSE